MADKLGPYVSKLMTVVIDNEEDEFVKILFECLYELTILDPDVSRFLNRIDYYHS